MQKRRDAWFTSQRLHPSLKVRQIEGRAFQESIGVLEDKKPWERSHHWCERAVVPTPQVIGLDQIGKCSRGGGGQLPTQLGGQNFMNWKKACVQIWPPIFFVHTTAKLVHNFQMALHIQHILSRIWWWWASFAGKKNCPAEEGPIGEYRRGTNCWGGRHATKLYTLDIARTALRFSDGRHRLHTGGMALPATATRLKEEWGEEPCTHNR